MFSPLRQSASGSTVSDDGDNHLAVRDDVERIPLRRSEILGVSLSGLLQFRTVFDEPVCVLSLVSIRVQVVFDLRAIIVVRPKPEF